MIDFVSGENISNFFVRFVQFIETLFNAISSIWAFLINPINFNFTIKLLNIDFRLNFIPLDIFGVGLIVLLILLFIKKFVPMA